MNKGEKIGKRGSSPFGGIRKRLSDITNLHSQLRSSPHVASKDKVNTPLLDGSSTKNYIEQLHKENEAMVKLVQEKEKVIESTGLEMQKLRALVHKAQLQNWELAQSNSQMLAELNMGKDKLKLLRHELACKESLIKAKSAEFEKNPITKCESLDPEVVRGLPNGAQMQEKRANLMKEPPNQPLQDKSESKLVRTKKRDPSRSRSMGPTTSQQATDKEMAENKRRCLRRQSVRPNPKQAVMDLFELDVANNSNSDVDIAGIEKHHEESPNDSGQQRLSLGRPLRRGVGKVQTYKEPSLRVKMRRPM